MEFLIKKEGDLNDMGAVKNMQKINILKIMDYVIKVVIIVVLIFLLLEFASFLLFKIYHQTNNPVESSSLLGDEKWRKQYTKENREAQNMEFAPYVINQMKEYKGQLININNKSIDFYI